MHIPSTIRSVAIFNASHVTTELPYALLSTLQKLFSRTQNISIVSDWELGCDNILYIIICPKGLTYIQYTNMPKYYITYQLDAQGSFQKYYVDILSGALYNWDYSHKNVKILTDIGIKSIYIPIGFNDSISTQELLDGTYEYDDKNKDIDVLFLGWDVHPHRAHIKNMLYLHGVKIWFVCALDLQGMKDAIKRSKICINLHVNKDWDVFQTIRMNILLSNQSCIVSEAINDDEIEVYKNKMIFVPYEGLVATCVELLRRPDIRKKYAMESFNWYKTERRWENLLTREILPVPEFQKN